MTILILKSCLQQISVDVLISYSLSTNISTYISFSKIGNTFGINVVYTSRDYLKRRKLWNSLAEVQSSHNIPWVCIREFKFIIGAREHRSAHTPSMIPTEAFLNLLDTNNPIHIPTKGSKFTWSNERKSSQHTGKKI